MPSRALEVLNGLDGVASRQEIVAASSDRAVDWAVRAGQVLRVLPRTLLAPGSADDWLALCRAVTTYAGEEAAVSHLSALRLWGLPSPEAERIDVLVPHGRRPRAQVEDPLAHVHRSRHLAATRTRHGVRVVTLERAVVESWPLLIDDAQRAPAIVAVRRRLTTPARLRLEVAEHPRLRGRRSLLELIDLLERGCHSELELWGHVGVFTGPRFAHLQLQVPLVLRGRTHYLDRYDEGAMLDIELDGRAYHDSPQDRERDIARDALVAETGRLTLRFSHRRLTGDPEGCREQTWRVMQVRRRQLHRGRSTGDPPPR